MPSKDTELKEKLEAAWEEVSSIIIIIIWIDIGFNLQTLTQCILQTEQPGRGE